MKIQLAKSPCYPPYSVVVGDRELWDCDCASGSIERTLELAAEQYPGEEVIGFDDPRHYSNKKEDDYDSDGQHKSHDPRFQVQVSNLGTVYDGQDAPEALRVFATYERQSKALYGRSAGEAVTLFKDDEIIREYIPPVFGE